MILQAGMSWLIGIGFLGATGALGADAQGNLVPGDAIRTQSWGKAIIVRRFSAPDIQRARRAMCLVEKLAARRFASPPSSITYLVKYENERSQGFRGGMRFVGPYGLNFPLDRDGSDWVILIKDVLFPRQDTLGDDTVNLGTTLAHEAEHYVYPNLTEGQVQANVDDPIRQAFLASLKLREHGKCSSGTGKFSWKNRLERYGCECGVPLYRPRQAPKGTAASRQ